MPELPEVEVLRRSLEPHCVGRTLRKVEVFEPRLRQPIDPPSFAVALRGRRVIHLRRRAKYLLMGLTGDRTLLVHLGMSGNLIWSPEQRDLQKHQHVRVHLDDGSLLSYQDPRRFGLLEVADSRWLENNQRLAHLGVEPLTEAFSGEYLRSRAGKRRRRIKEFLMDQTVVVGVGNIYASEALHRAAINPKRAVSRVSLTTWEALVLAVKETLERAIARGGSTLSDFRNGRGESGYFQIEHAVYDRQGKQCLRCDGVIRRIVQGNRSTFYCPRCQH